MTNVVLGVGTDARVAKFLKRGLEVTGLTVLDSVEIWNRGKLAAGPFSSTPEQPAPGSARNSLENHHPDALVPQTPESSAISLGSAGDPIPKVRDPTPSLVRGIYVLECRIYCHICRIWCETFLSLA